MVPTICNKGPRVYGLIEGTTLFSHLQRQAIGTEGMFQPDLYGATTELSRYSSTAKRSSIEPMTQSS